MALAKYLVDTSVIARERHRDVAVILEPLRESALLALCGVTQLEILYSARSGVEHREIEADLNRAYECLYTEEQDLVRAREIQGELADGGRHLAVSSADLIIAAVAERHRVTVLHYDADFDLIGQVTGQAMEWVVPRGSVG